MKDRWIISDTHFGHANIIKFKKLDGTPIRPGFTRPPTRAFTTFKDIQHHDECLIDNWNRLVKPGDLVYHLGDFGRMDGIIQRLNGKKRLILGNHDDKIDFDLAQKHFEKILVSRIFTTEFVRPVIFSHFPLHKDESSPAPRYVNVHGHIHEKNICDSKGNIDPWYINVAVEQTNCHPMNWDELNSILKKRGV